MNGFFTKRTEDCILQFFQISYPNEQMRINRRIAADDKSITFQISSSDVKNIKFELKFDIRDNFEATVYINDKIYHMIDTWKLILMAIVPSYRFRVTDVRVVNK